MGVGWKSSHSERSTMTTAIPQTTASHAIGETTPALLRGTISANLDATIARFGDREALIDRAQGIRWTYAAFGAEVDRLARALMAVGARSAAVTIRSSISCGTGRCDSARFERLAAISSST